MAEADLIAALGFLALFAMMALRVPVGIAMGLVGVFGFAAVRGIDPALDLLASSPIRVLTDANLMLIPFFVLMGILANNAGLSRELFRAGQAWFGGLKGGLALSTIAACAGFSAISGSSVATAATMTKVALPEMRRARYPEDCATGVVAAGGTLGILIPPSVVLAVYAYITEQDVGKLFVAGIVPGIVAIVLYMATVRIAFRGRLPGGPPFRLREALASLSGIWAVLLLFLAIIGALYLGVATPTEAAAVGAFLTMAIGVARRRLTARTIRDSLAEALRTATAIYTILVGASLFGYFLAITRTPQTLTAFLVDLDLGAYATLFLVLLLFLLAGCVLDAMAMIILMVPIVFPVITGLGFDPIWFGIIVVVTVELALVTPPVGMNVFVINSIARNVRLTTVFRGILPFVAADVVRLVLYIAFPALVLWLPGTMR